MSSSGPWRVDCRLLPSRRERRCRVLIAGLAALALLDAEVPWPGFLAGLLVWLAACGFTGRRPPGHAPVMAFREIPGGWRLQLNEGNTVFARLHGPVRDVPGLLCLAWREAEEDVLPGARPRVWRVALWSDQLTAEDWRRLRVSLRWRRRAGPARCPAPPRQRPDDPACSAGRVTRGASARSE